MKINEVLNESEQLDEIPKWLGGTGGVMPGTSSNNMLSKAGTWLKKKTGKGPGGPALKQAKTVSNFAYKKWLETVTLLQQSGKLMAGDTRGYLKHLSNFTKKQFELKTDAQVMKFLATVGNKPTKKTIINGFYQAFLDSLVQNRLGNDKQRNTTNKSTNQKAKATGKTQSTKKASDGNTYKWVVGPSGSEWHDLGGNMAPDNIQQELGTP